VVVVVEGWYRDVVMVDLVDFGTSSPRVDVVIEPTDMNRTTDINEATARRVIRR
jgi:hypothetical protein